MKKYIESFVNYRFLLWELVKKGIKLKYRRSYLGIIWSLLEPLLTMIVLTIVFGTILGTRTKEFSVYILCGRLLYNFYSTSTKSALTSIRRNAAMIKKVYVPKYLYTLSSILYNYIIFLISLIVLVVVAAVLNVRPTLGVFFRDMEYLWGVALMLIMYMCAIFYQPEKILDSSFSWILKFNPLYSIISIFRDAVFGRLMNVHYFLYALGFSVVTMVVGLIMFVKKQDDFILQI